MPSSIGQVAAGSIFSLTGVINLIDGLGLWIKRKWAPWLMVTIFAAATFFGSYNIGSFGFSRVVNIIPWAIPATIVDVLFVVYCLVRRTK